MPQEDRASVTDAGQQGPGVAHGEPQMFRRQAVHDMAGLLQGLDANQRAVALQGGADDVGALQAGKLPVHVGLDLVQQAGVGSH